MYGTYFKFTNFKTHNCDGVFLIDTEGLFASLSNTDKRKRLNFDRKLVLFCLAISDIVLINTKGNLDNESIKILKSCKKKFEGLGNQTKL